MKLSIEEIKLFCENFFNSDLEEVYNKMNEVYNKMNEQIDEDFNIVKTIVTLPKEMEKNNETKED